jgi:hypothetical protein
MLGWVGEEMETSGDAVVQLTAMSVTASTVATEEVVEPSIWLP